MNNSSDNSSLLEELNQEQAKHYLGGVVFVTLLMVTGIIGNIHVLLVYTFRIKPSNHRVYILILGALDLTTCCVGMPFIIVELRNPLTFTLTSICKLLRFFLYFLCCSSVLILLVVAVDRYRKICVPFGRQISRSLSKMLCLLAIAIALMITCPAYIMFGDSTVRTKYPDVTGVKCSAKDKYKGTTSFLYFNAVLIVCAFGFFITLVVLYGLIGKVISRQLKKFGNSTKYGSSMADDHTVSNRKSRNATVKTPETKDTYFCSIENEQKGSESHTSKDNSGNSTIGVDDIKVEKLKEIESNAVNTNTKGADRTSKDSSENSTIGVDDIKVEKLKEIKPIAMNTNTKVADRTRRTTLILFLVTLVFFMSYIPHLILTIISLTTKDFFRNMTFSGKVTYNTFFWCFFINNMANSIIYGFCDNHFRQEVRAIYASVVGSIACK